MLEQLGERVGVAALVTRLVAPAVDVKTALFTFPPPTGALINIDPIVIALAAIDSTGALVDETAAPARENHDHRPKLNVGVLHVGIGDE